MRVPDKYDSIYRLRFGDEALSGLDVRIRRSWGLVSASAELAAVDLDAVRAGQAQAEDLRRLDQLVDAFADALVSWNLEGGDGQPLATGRDTVRSLDIRMVLALVSAFHDALRELTEELEQAAQVSEGDLPMDS